MAKNQAYLDFFMPSWSPGSYLMREYGRFVRHFQATNESGDFLYYEQMDKGTWRVSLNKNGMAAGEGFSVSYLVYCHELTVRTSHVDRSHAFIHGPSVFMGIKEHDTNPIELKLTFPADWNKVSTGLVEIEKNRQEFVYKADNYDDFIDCPIEIGNHQTDGFKVNGKDHELAFYGGTSSSWP